MKPTRFRTPPENPTACALACKTFISALPARLAILSCGRRSAPEDVQAFATRFLVPAEAPPACFVVPVTGLCLSLSGVSQSKRKSIFLPWCGTLRGSIRCTRPFAAPTAAIKAKTLVYDQPVDSVRIGAIARYHTRRAGRRCQHGCQRAGSRSYRPASSWRAPGHAASTW